MMQAHFVDYTRISSAQTTKFCKFTSLKPRISEQPYITPSLLSSTSSLCVCGILWGRSLSKTEQVPVLCSHHSLSVRGMFMTFGRKQNNCHCCECCLTFMFSLLWFPPNQTRVGYVSFLKGLPWTQHFIFTPPLCYLGETLLLYTLSVPVWVWVC